MKEFEVYTQWRGYSIIRVQAENKEEAQMMVEDGDYDPSNEVMTGNGLNAGYEEEEVIEVVELGVVK